MIMKKIFNYFVLVIIIGFGLWSCEDYLDVPPDASISEEDIFSKYQSFQGFVDQLYTYLVDYNNHTICVSPNLGGETIGSKPWSSGYHGAYGQYWSIVSDWSRSIYVGYGSATSNLDQRGLWDFCWEGSRICNIALRNLEKMVDATQEERDLIEGQARFFRAYYHWEIARAYGSIPYVDTLLNENNIRMPRYWEYTRNGKTYKNTQAVFERCVEDLDIAASKLPEIWDPEEAASGSNQPNLGRITKGAALALKAKVLLFSGSPLFNEDGGNGPNFNSDLLMRSAQAAWEVIKLANKGVYSLTNFDPNEDLDEYRRMFATVDGTFPYSEKETIFEKVDRRQTGASQFNNALSRTYSTGEVGGNAVIETATQNYVDKWEMADGTRYKPGRGVDGGYDDDPNRRWNGRDPRFRKTFWVNGDNIGKLTFNLYVGGKTRTANVKSPYFIHKFWPERVDNKNKDWRQFQYATPLLRLADIYLVYAEAIFEASGDANARAQGADLSAVDAVNRVRQRVGMPPVTANPVAYQTILEGHGEEANDPPFRRLIRNERAVELAFEGHYWWDIRRWKIANKVDKNLYRLDFDKDMTYTSREVVQQYVFESRHYWLPFPTNLTLMYEGWPQNPGW